MGRPIRALVVAVLVLGGCVALAEVGRRILDGYRVWTPMLVRNPDNVDLTWSSPRSNAALLRTIPLDPEADTAWFDDRPQTVPDTSPAWAEKRRIASGDEANYVWNAERIRHPEFMVHMRSRDAALNDVFTFRPPGGGPYPLYRFYPGIQTGHGFSNRFGWRGPEIEPQKPSNVIRIGTLGDSTTNAYPRLVEHWLNLWAARRSLGVRFEVVNAARVASGALDAAAILDFELSCADLDYVVVYGFGNGMYLADALIKLPPGVTKGQPGSATASTGLLEGASKRFGAVLEPGARRSAAVAFLRSRVMGQRGSDLIPEPPKPVTKIEFPPEIDERSPNPAKLAGLSSGGLMELDTYLRGLDSIDVMAKNRGLRLFVSSFRIMAFDGMLLSRGATYDVLNGASGESWWPYTYAQIQRLTAFYNRTLRVWADARGHDVIQVDEHMPWRPELYGDAMHELSAGEALHGWIVLQQLLPRLRDDLAHRRLPRPARPPRPDVDEYWKIQRTSLADAVNAPPPGAADDIAGAFPVSKIVAANANAEVVPGDVPLIRTAMAPSGYAASIPIGASAAASLTGKGWVGVRVRVKEGRITVGLLDRAGLKFIAYQNLEHMPDVQTAYLMLGNLADAGSLVISNNGTEAFRSVVELHGVTTKRFRQ